MNILPLSGVAAVAAGATGVLQKSAQQVTSFVQSLASPPEKPPVADPQADELKLQSALKELRQKLRDAGVDLNDPVKLRKADDGQLQVAHFRFDAERVDAVLSENRDLTSQIAALLPPDSELRIDAREN